MIDGLDLAHLDKPILEFLRCGNQHTTTMVLSLAQHRVQVFDACHDAHGHFTAIGRCLWAWIQSGAETFADFLHACLQLVALKEDDEHRLVDIVTLNEIDKRSHLISIVIE